MGNINIVTGHTGSNHVTSKDFASYNAGTFGNVTAVLNRGNKFSATLNVNTVRVNSGDIMIQGHHIRINSGEYVELTVPFASSGINRIDAIAVRYSKNTQTGIEDANLVVVQGHPTSGLPYAPQLQTGDILDGTSLVTEVALYYVRVSGSVISDLTAVFTTADSLSDHVQNVSNPHSVTAEQVGAAEADHNHSVFGTYTGTGGSGDIWLPTVEGKLPKIVHIIASYPSTDNAVFIVQAGNGLSTSEGSALPLRCDHNAETNRFAWWHGGLTARQLMNAEGETYSYIIQY